MFLLKYNGTDGRLDEGAVLFRKPACSMRWPAVGAVAACTARARPATAPVSRCTKAMAASAVRAFILGWVMRSLMRSVELTTASLPPCTKNEIMFILVL
jgi:hypothetical protein